ncbi:hypothetical protein [Burkholderia sp. Nafp2/4-1b]|nr:hypothetical protein [Burkholderia sp. Nafp2/4-1b]
MTEIIEIGEMVCRNGIVFGRSVGLAEVTDRRDDGKSRMTESLLLGNPDF